MTTCFTLLLHPPAVLLCCAHKHFSAGCDVATVVHWSFCPFSLNQWVPTACSLNVAVKLPFRPLILTVKSSITLLLSLFQQHHWWCNLRTISLCGWDSLQETTLTRTCSKGFFCCNTASTILTGRGSQFLHCLERKIKNKNIITYSLISDWNSVALSDSLSAVVTFDGSELKIKERSLSVIIYDSTTTNKSRRVCHML